MAGPGTVLVAHPSAELYGSDRVLLESVSGLVEAGRRVVVTLPGRGPLVDELERRGAEVELCPTLVLRKALLRPRGWFTLVRDSVLGLVRGAGLIRRTAPSVVLVNTVTIPLWLVLARLGRRRSVCHVHEAERSAHPVVRRALALPVLLADAVVANSRFSIGVLADSFAGLGARATLLANAVPGPAEVMPARTTIEGPLRVVYVGRLSERKGVDVAVAAIAVLRARGVAASLDVVGAVFPGYEWFEDALRETVRREGLADLVHLHGFVDPVWPVVAAGDVLVVPSRVDEPFGNTAVEGLLCARPVIASATSGLLEATAGFTSATTVTPGDADALAAELEAVATGWSARSEAAARDARTAADRHSPQVYRRALAAIVDEVTR